MPVLLLSSTDEEAGGEIRGSLQVLEQAPDPPACSPSEELPEDRPGRLWVRWPGSIAADGRFRGGACVHRAWG
jgi:hypothetical protein